LRSLQARFASALLAPGHDAPECLDFAQALAGDDLAALARLRVYRNNSRLVQIDALGRTFAVLRRRVGEEFFEQLAAEYRAAHPSPRGDLHWIGERFPVWLAERLAATGYEWLVDLARLEWACEQALVAPDAAAIALDALGRIPAESLAGTTLTLHPSVHAVSSPWPVWSVWKENQPGAAGRAVDLEQGAEHVIVACVDGGLVLLSMAETDLLFTAELLAGRALGVALENSGLALDSLAPLLGRLFAEGLVTGIGPVTGERTP
jgi:hypothetical protein